MTETAVIPQLHDGARVRHWAKGFVVIVDGQREVTQRVHGDIYVAISHGRVHIGLECGQDAVDLLLLADAKRPSLRFCEEDGAVLQEALISGGSLRRHIDTVRVSLDFPALMR